MDEISPRLDAALASLPENFSGPAIGLILGSGLNDIANDIQTERAVDTARIAGLKPSTAPSHTGQLIKGTLYDVPIMALQGRVHLYEGYSALDVAMPVYLLARLGVQTLMVTNAAGGLNPAFEAGSVALINDHINLTGHSPLIGVDAPSIGVRFPDMSRAYDPQLRDLVKRTARDAKIALNDGIYVGVTGPSLETSAERRMFAGLGGDLVGMSTVMEVIAANHAGMRVLGLSVVTNKATGGDDQQPDSLEEVLANAATGGRVLRRLLTKLLSVI